MIRQINLNPAPPIILHGIATVHPVYRIFAMLPITKKLAQKILLFERDIGVWGALDEPFRSDDIMLPFDWEEMYFAQSAIIAGKRTAKGLRYSVFSNYWKTKGKLIIDGLTAVTVPKGDPWDGYDFSARLIERDGKWGVLQCSMVLIEEEPVLSREEAERAFWLCEGYDEEGLAD